MLEQELNNAQAPDKPFISGDTVGDVVKAVPNALLGIPTDLVDLGLGLVDTGSGQQRPDPDYNRNDDGEMV